MVEFAVFMPLALLLVLGGVDLSIMGSDKVMAVSAARHGARVASELGGSTDTSKAPNSCNGAKPVNQSGAAPMLATDQTIVQTVLGAFLNASFIARSGAVAPYVGSLPDEIVIYHPHSTGGQFDGGPDRDGKELNPDGSLRFPTTAPLGVDEYEQYLPSDNFATNQNTPGHISRPSPPLADQGTHTGSNFILTNRCQGQLGNEAEIGVMMIWTYKPANGVPGPRIELTEWSVEKESLCVQNCVTS
jgi:hypothetical protein